MNKTAREYQAEVTQYIKKRGLPLDPRGLCIGELLGDVAHTYLLLQKGEMLIKKAETFLLEAMGAAMLYVLHNADVNHTFLSFDEAIEYGEKHDEKDLFTILGWIHRDYGTLLFNAVILPTPGDDMYRAPLQRLLNGMFAFVYGLHADPVQLIRDSLQSLQSFLAAINENERS